MPIIAIIIAIVQSTTFSFKSVIDIISSPEQSVIASSVFHSNPNFIKQTEYKIAVAISIKGYCMLIFSLQKAHLPRKKIYDKTGILCQGFSLLLHLGHFDGGKAMFSFASERNITTLKKLPRQSPNIKVQKRV